jgi:GNAT superfamily N-acetyltransferase
MIEDADSPATATESSLGPHEGKIAGGVRPLQDRDFPQLAVLHDRCFNRAIHKDRDSLLRQMRKVFQDNPWRDHGIDSLVWDDGSGRVLGFAGLLARPMRFRGNPLLAALSCQVMVAPEARGHGIAEALLRASTEGPQTLTYSDILNPAATAVWRRIGGTEIPELSLQWIRPIRPFQWFAGQALRKTGRNWTVRLARPVLYILDALTRSASNSPYSFPESGAWALRPLSPGLTWNSTGIWRTAMNSCRTTMSKACPGYGTCSRTACEAVCAWKQPN